MPIMGTKQEDNPDSVPIYTYRSKSTTERRTIVWEIEDMEKIMSEGIQKTFGLEFPIGHPQTPGFESDQSNADFLGYSKWRLQLETVNDEPALSLLLLESTSKVIYYKLAVQVLQTPGSPTVMAYPHEDYFYEATPWESRESAKKFTLHCQQDFGSSYTQWLPKCVADDGTLRLKVDVKICEALAHSGYSNGKFH